jgi:hypothetical protein
MYACICRIGRGGEENGRKEVITPFEETRGRINKGARGTRQSYRVVCRFTAEETRGAHMNEVRAERASTSDAKEDMRHMENEGRMGK